MAHQHPPRFLKIVDDAKTRVRETNVDAIKTKMDRGDKFVLVDVREESEYHGELGHIAGARLIPLKELPERTGELGDARSSDIVAICRVGVRSATAAAILTGLGFEHVWNLKGGMIEWKDAQLPVER